MLAESYIKTSSVEFLTHFPLVPGTTKETYKSTDEKPGHKY